MYPQDLTHISSHAASVYGRSEQIEGALELLSVVGPKSNRLETHTQGTEGTKVVADAVLDG